MAVLHERPHSSEVSSPANEYRDAAHHIKESDIVNSTPSDSIYNNTIQDSHLTNMDRSSPAPSGVNNTWSAPVSPEQEPPTSDTNIDEVAAIDDHEDDKPDESIARTYELRPQARKLKGGFTSTWIDKDKSGNYGERDRNEEVRKARVRRNRLNSKKREATDAFDEDGADDEHSRSPKKVRSIIVTLNFQSDVSRAEYEDIIAKMPAKTKAESDESPNRYKLRTKVSRYYSECNLDKLRFAPDLPDDLAGYPLARGCWECIGLGIHCPLLDDERAWPCTTCIHDDHDCTLVTPPVLKRACERCKSRRTGCSYTQTFNHGEACRQCMESGHRCVAGPAKESIRTRIRYDRDWVNDPLPKTRIPKPRKHSSEEDQVTILVENNGRASIARKCRALRQHDGTEKVALNDPKPPKRSKGTTTKISTKFCHPIVFNHNDKGNEPCHFCAEAGYAIFGLGAKEVEVIEWQDGRGLEEISGGHKGDGVENTRICASCTLQRLPIIMCPVHELRPIVGVKQNALDINTAFAELLSGSAKTKNVKWCAICPSLATYECCSPSDNSEGCGLTVCEQCMVMLSGVYDGDLQKMLPEVRDEPTEERMLGLRADHELLRDDGLLMRYVLWNSQQK